MRIEINNLTEFHKNYLNSVIKVLLKAYSEHRLLAGANFLSTKVIYKHVLTQQFYS